MLSINISELVLTIASFFLLYFLLNTFLFKPVMKFMDERQARIDKGEAIRNDALKAVKESEQLMADKLSESREEAQRYLADQRMNDEASRQALSEKLRSESADVRHESEQRTEALRKAESEELAAQLPSLASLLADKILSGK